MKEVVQSKYKIVLSLSHELNIPLVSIQKYVQWYKIEKGINYDFINGHSFELENDIKTFIVKDYLSKKCPTFDLKLEEKMAVQSLQNKIAKGEEFVLPAIAFHPKQKQNTLFTIGYEGISIDGYINTLLINHIKTLVDVRKNAYSNKFGFSKKEFMYFLDRSGIKYIHIPELGIESAKRQELKTAKNYSSNNYDLFSSSIRNIETEENGVFINEHSRLQNKLFEDYKNNLSSKHKYIDKLLQILQNDKLIAITCFEADHKCCHRHLLAESLSRVEVRNI